MNKRIVRALWRLPNHASIEDAKHYLTLLLVIISKNGTQIYEPVAQFDATTGRVQPIPIDAAGTAGDAHLVLFGTGWKNRLSAPNVTVYIGGVSARVQYVGAQGDFAGLDQMNILIPRQLAGRGDVEVLVTVDGKMANPVKLRIK